MHEKLVTLLGSEISDSGLVERLHQLGLPEARIDQFDEDTYYGFPTRGISLVFEDGVLSAVQLFAAGTEPGFSEYRDDLPDGVRFTWGKVEILKRLGTPEKTGAASQTRSLTLPSWIRYDRGVYKLHLQFSSNETRITRVSLLGTK